MVFLQRIVGDDVVINKWVFVRTEVPWLFLWIVRSILKPSEFVFEIQHVVCLLITEGSVLVACQSVDKVFMFSFSCKSFNISICISLSYRVVLGFIQFHLFECHFFVCFGFSLKLFLLFRIIRDRIFPFIVVIISREKHFVWCSLCHLLVNGWKHCHFIVKVI